MKKKYLFVLLVFAITITFCGTATAEEQNTTQINQSDTNTQTTVNDQASLVQDNSIVDTSNTTNSTENIIQDTQLDTDPQNTVSDQATNSSTTQNTQNSASNDITTTSYAANEDPVVITFDDGFESTYTIAFPIMEQYGIKGTVYVTPAWIGSPGYLTLAQLTALHNAGWTIANHSWDHPALPSLTTAQITTEIQSTITWLNNNGFSDGAYHLAYPFGQYNSNVIQVATNLGIKTARTVNWGTIGPNDNVNYLQLPIILMRSDTTRSDWQSELDRSIAQSGTAIFLFHDIITGNPVYLEDVTVTNFRTVIQYINQTGVKTLTISQWYNERFNIDSLSMGITSDKANYNPGENVVYTLDVLNNGANATTNVVVRDTLPAGLTFVSATNGGVYNAGVITWNLASLAVNSHFKPSFTATVNQGTAGQNIINTASASSTQVTTPVTSQATIIVNNPNTAAEIIINFDDGYQSVYTVAFPIMQQYGIKGTVYVITSEIGSPGYLTLAQLTALHNAGWTIANHSYRHWWMPELTTTQITTEIQTAINWLNNNGFQDGAYHFAYPYGEYDSRVLQIENQLGIKTARTIKSGTINPNGSINYLELPSNGFTRSTTTAQWKSWVDQAIASSSTSIILLHSIVNTPSSTEDVSLTTFTAFIQYLAQTGVKTPTISQWYNEVNNPAPVAAFTATPLTGSAPLTVAFTDQSTGSSLSYSWDFNNDGTADSTAKSPSYTYSTAGTYSVKLTVTNTIGSNSIIKTNYITVNIPAPVANFTATPTSGTAPLNVQFTDQSTGTVTGWAWDFNNDGTVDNTTKNPNYVYNTPGTYTVKLTVSNSGGNNSITRTNYITVTNVAPVANFTATPTSGTAPLTVVFNDQSTGNPTSYQWDFNNDGTVDSTSQNPSYTYNTAGTYTVKLTVTNSTGSNSLTRTNYITVTTTTTRPDLVISNLQVPSSPQVGTTYPVNFTVSNSGSANAGSFVVNLMDGTTTIGQQTISSLAAGQSTTVTLNWTPTVTGLRTINATADVNNAITETNETNNNISQQVTVVAQGSSNLLSTNQQGVETNLTGFDDYLCTLTRDTSVKYAGNASAKAVASSGFSQLMFAGNSVAVTAGTNYIASAYVRADVGTLGSQTITILYDWYGSSGHLAYNYQMINVSSFGENVWHYIELAAKAPAGATSVYMSIALSNAVSGDTYWYDSGILQAV